MSSLRNIFVIFTFFLPSFLLLASKTTANFNSNLIEKACTINRPNWDFDFCIKLLNSDPKISSATSPFDLAIAIVQAGNSHASETQDYINQKLSEGGTNTVVSSALSVCSKWYGGVLGAFITALDNVQDQKTFQSAKDHVESANDYAMNCEETFASRDVQDDEISKGDNLVMYFSLSAGAVINVPGDKTIQHFDLFCCSFL
ncbi:cell wall / vacuolar inhibitor of fructosidase 2-like [Lycium barbarum]|uniref:cell wall / vacuolar inhibitor of fructosidase 2-like n=1 Tax=Lycium barbarum TaxID=112863 RepID=UPI00293F1BD1|nr:cell wall / vacuolar inhibitor of fructosidase 2-like [Lycium barbarum]